MTLPPPDPRSPKRRLWGAFSAILIFTASPFLCLGLASLIAWPLGCALHSGGADCFVGGVNIGTPLTVLGFLVVYIVVTAPLGLIFLLVWGVAAFKLYRRGKMQS